MSGGSEEDSIKSLIQHTIHSNWAPIGLQLGSVHNHYTRLSPTMLYVKWPISVSLADSDPWGSFVPFLCGEPCAVLLWAVLCCTLCSVIQSTGAMPDPKAGLALVIGNLHLLSTRLHCVCILKRSGLLTAGLVRGWGLGVGNDQWNNKQASVRHSMWGTYEKRNI